MKILALETSTPAASLALFDDQTLLEQQFMDQKQRSAAALTPALDQAFKKVQWLPQDVDLIAVSEGPGSFTGLRIGITTAKTLAYVTKADVLSINSLRVVAQQAPISFEEVTVAIDAQRKQLFVASFVREEKLLWQQTTEVKIVDAESWIKNLDSHTAIMGNGLLPYQQRIPQEITIISPELFAPTAKALGQLAWADYQSGRRDDLWKLLPKYYRKSAAEEKLLNP